MTDHDVLCDIRDQLRAIHAQSLARIEAYLRDIRDAVAGNPHAHPLDLPNRASHGGAPLPVVPYEQIAAMMGRDAGPTMGVSGPLIGVTAARADLPAGSDAEQVAPAVTADLDTALTMGMEAPAPLVPTDRKGPASLYPSDKVPGVVFPQITEKDVCVPGYAKRVRAVNDAMKRAVFLRDGLDPAKHESLEVDHYVSLCLGGTNDFENLWSEPAVTPDAPGQIGFRAKDATEAFLYHEVCQGNLSLRSAQDMIRSDWYAVFLTIPHSHPALMLASFDAPEQP